MKLTCLQTFLLMGRQLTQSITQLISHIFDEFSITRAPMFDKVVALVMVFDLIIRPRFLNLNIRNGSHASHSAHVKYRRRVLNLDESAEIGICETDGNYLLGDEGSSSDEIKRSCMEWCLDHNIEYIEACASNPRFDKCLSVDGDSQGVERIVRALFAHMWPGMVLKSGDTINQPSLPEQESSDE